jgi:hypothetical protein
MTEPNTLVWRINIQLNNKAAGLWPTLLKRVEIKLFTAQINIFESIVRKAEQL